MRIAEEACNFAFVLVAIVVTVEFCVHLVNVRNCGMHLREIEHFLLDSERGISSTFASSITREIRNCFASAEITASLNMLCLVLQAVALSPKIAVPTRTHVDPSRIATSKSCDIPIESTSMLTRGRWRAAVRSRNSRS